MRRGLDLRDDRGFAAIEMPLAIGLFLIPLALIVITLPTWPERQTVARAAATEAARAAVLADSWEDGIAAGEEAVAQAASNHGFDASDISVSWAGSFERGGSITATVTVRMPALVIPGVTAVEAWTWSSSHTERVDDYRSLP